MLLELLMVPAMVVMVVMVAVAVLLMAVARIPIMFLTQEVAVCMVAMEKARVIQEAVSCSLMPGLALMEKLEKMPGALTERATDMVTLLEPVVQVVAAAALMVVPVAAAAGALQEVLTTTMLPGDIEMVLDGM